MAIVVCGAINYASGKIGVVLAALSVALITLEGWESHEYHQEDKAGDSQHKHDFDDGEAFFSG